MRRMILSELGEERDKVDDGLAGTFLTSWTLGGPEV
jgi:hypothetical protein